jgi:hypothetical protein
MFFGFGGILEPPLIGNARALADRRFEQPATQEDNMPHNHATRIFAVLCLALGLIAISSITVSSVAAHTPESDISAQEPLAPQAASIIVTKTVGTNPAICAATKTITLPVGGGSAYYCYTVRNTGNVTLTRHTLVDNRLGTILSNFPYSLAPGASAFLTQSAVITTTTINSTTWTASNPGPIDVASDSDTATVNATPFAQSIIVTKTVGTDSAVCATTKTITLTASGGAVYYCYMVRNTGNLTLTQHTLVDNRLGILLSSFPYSLVPGASAFLMQSAVITATTTNSATWTAFNAGSTNTTLASATAIVVIQRRVYLPLVLRQ